MENRGPGPLRYFWDLGGTPGANWCLAGSEPVHTWFGVGEPLVQLVLLGRTM